MSKLNFQPNIRMPIIFLISGFPLTISAAPSITGVFSSTDSLNNVIITGQNFTNGPNVVLFDNFNQGGEGQVVPLDSPLVGSWSSYGTLGRPVFTAESDDHLGYFIRDFDRPVSDGNSQAQLIKVFDSYQSEIYFSFSAKVPSGRTFAGASETKTFPSVSSWKFSWLMSGSKGFEYGDGNFDLCVPTHVGNGTFLIGGNDGNLTYIKSGSGWWDWNNFNDFAFYLAFDKTSPASNPINWLMEITSGVTWYSTSGTASPDNFNNTDNRFDRINFSGWWGNGSLDNFSGVYDNIYVSVGENSRSRVVITNHRFRNESTRSITVPPVSWQNDKIEIDNIVVPDWPEVFFHISDSNGNFSTEGAPICPNCPSPVQPTIK